MDGLRAALDELENSLKGWPDQLLTVALVVVGVVLILVGLFSPSRLAKAGALAWVVVP